MYKGIDWRIIDFFERKFREKQLRKFTVWEISAELEWPIEDVRKELKKCMDAGKIEEYVILDKEGNLQSSYRLYPINMKCYLCWTPVKNGMNHCSECAVIVEEKWKEQKKHQAKYREKMRKAVQ